MAILKDPAKQKNPKTKELQSHFNLHYNPAPSHLIPHREMKTALLEATFSV